MESGNTNLFACYAHIDLVPFAFDLPSICGNAPQIGLGHKKIFRSYKYSLLAILIGTKDYLIRGTTLIMTKSHLLSDLTVLSLITMGFGICLLENSFSKSTLE